IQEGAYQLKFVQAVADVFGARPKSAMLFEGDFVTVEIEQLGMVTLGEQARFFPWPSIDGSPPMVVTAGDQAVALTDRPAAMALIAFLASTEAAEIAAAQGGFLSPNRHLDPAAYPDPTTRALARSLAAAEILRYDLSDLAPLAFGAGTDASMWRLLQEFLVGEGVPGGGGQPGAARGAGGRGGGAGRGEVVSGAGSWTRRKRRAAVIFLAPLLLVVGALVLVPIVQTTWTSLYSEDGSRFVGL